MNIYQWFQNSIGASCRTVQSNVIHKTRSNLSLSSLIGLALLMGVLSVAAQPYTIDWYTVDGGGAMNIGGGTYIVSGTIGQPDAGRMLGGNDSIDGGFWGLIALVPPRLTITRSSNNVIICWPSPSTGFKLQQSVGLAPATWTDVGQAPVDNGTTKCVTLPIAAATTFYRLTN
jgi:hypothetical protein